MKKEKKKVDCIIHNKKKLDLLSKKARKRRHLLRIYYLIMYIDIYIDIAYIKIEKNSNLKSKILD